MNTSAPHRNPIERLAARRLPLILCGLLILWLGSALVRVENERYALMIGMCRTEIGHADIACLQKVETRTNPIWHLFYALTGA